MREWLTRTHLIENVLMPIGIWAVILTGVVVLYHRSSSASGVAAQTRPAITSPQGPTVAH